MIMLYVAIAGICLSFLMVVKAVCSVYESKRVFKAPACVRPEHRRTMPDVIEVHTATGGNFFRTATVMSRLIRGKYFVTEEPTPIGEFPRYTVMSFDWDTGEVLLFSKEQQYDSLIKAIDSVNG